MAKEKKIVISSSNTLGLQALYQIYIGQTGNESDTYDDFVQFLSVNSPDSQIFLDTYCNYTTVDMDVTIVLKLEPK